MPPEQLQRAPGDDKGFGRSLQGYSDTRSALSLDTVVSNETTLSVMTWVLRAGSCWERS